MAEAMIGLVGVLIGSFITVAKDLWTAHLERRQERAYSAIKLISILDEYAFKCSLIAKDKGHSLPYPGIPYEEGEFKIVAKMIQPAPPTYPNDIAWRRFGDQMVHRIIALPNEARRTDRYITLAEAYDFPTDYKKVFDTRQEGYARLGAEALEIATALRNAFDVSAENKARMPTDWDPAVDLRETIAKFDEQRRRDQ